MPELNKNRPQQLYCALLLFCSLSYMAMWLAVTAHHKNNAAFTPIARAARRKSMVSSVLYAAGIPLAYVHPAIAVACAFLVAAFHFVPEAGVTRLRKKKLV